MSKEAIELANMYSARNYLPLPVVLSWGEGVWVEDPEGRRYLDMLSCYSALNHGHRHPKLIQALREQADRITLTSRAFHNDQIGPLSAKLAKLCGRDMVLLMNTGVEAVETALKAARRWGYRAKGVSIDEAEIIVCEGNFHGRTITAVSFSSHKEYRQNFGPFTPGFKVIPYGDVETLKKAITPKTVAFLVEPIQGEAGVVIPPPGFISEAARICKENQVLLLADEIQTGLGRTGKVFGCDWEDVKPDVYILGKALGGGIIPISAAVADREVMGLFEPGSHGSTFGGNPLACAVAISALDVLEEEKLPERSNDMGAYVLNELKKRTTHPEIKEIRGRGLFVGVELHVRARPFCEKLMEEGLLCKETHDNVIRFAPPLVITREELDWALERVTRVL